MTLPASASRSPDLPRLLVAGLCTLLFLEGLSLGVRIARGLARTGSWPPLGVTAARLVESAVWVAVMAAAVAWLRTRRSRVWPLTLGLALVAAAVTLVRLRADAAAVTAPVDGALLDGVGFALGLLFYDFVYALLARPAPGAPHARP